MVGALGEGWAPMPQTPRDFEVELRTGAAGETLARADDFRRLADMILASFNHAYAIGAPDLADRLWGLLAEVETRQAAGQMGRTDNINAVRQAELWVEFVEARNRYRAALDGPEEGVRLEQAFLAMKAAYRRWSES
jgi:hypothetical protein